MKELQDKSLGSGLELVEMRFVRKEEGWMWTRGVRRNWCWRMEGWCWEGLLFLKRTHNNRFGVKFGGIGVVRKVG